jgi:hypothetical protein
MATMKIKIFSDFCTSEVCKEKFEKVCKSHLIENYGENKEIYITTNDDYTHAVILNKATPELKIPKSNVLGLACEPISFLALTPEFISYAKTHIGKYFIGDKNGLNPPFLENHGFMWFDHPASNKVIEKKNVMSIIFSEKNSAPGHKYRHALIVYIINNNLPIDIYGRGCQFLPDHLRNRANIKGIFNETEPYDNYIFTISIENFTSNHYFSEKIISPIMCGTIPIYLGCKNIDSYVKDFYVPMKGVYKDDIELILDVLKNPYQYMKDVKTPKEEIFDNLNFIKNVKNLF